MGHGCGFCPGSKKSPFVSSCETALKRQEGESLAGEPETNPTRAAKKPQPTTTTTQQKHEKHPAVNNMLQQTTCCSLPTTSSRRTKLTILYVGPELRRSASGHMFPRAGWGGGVPSLRQNLHVSCRVETNWSPSFGFVHHVFVLFSAVQVGPESSFAATSLCSPPSPAEPV